MFVVGAAALLMVPVSSDPVLLDGRCDPAEYAKAARHDLGQGVTLYALHGKDFINFCAALPPESLGSMDLYLQSPSGGAITNVHVSAQVGERTYQEGADPAWEWGNHRGWYGPPVAIRGSELRPDGKPRITFKDSTGREVQLSKARFGSGPWKFRYELRAIGPGQANTVRLPAEENGWMTLQLQ